MIAFSVSYPPSANRLWRAVKGRNIASADYRAWKAETVADIASQVRRHGVGGVILCPGLYRLTLTAGRPDRRRRDIGNLEKPVSDALVAAGVVRDDCDAERITVQWSSAEPSKSARVDVLIEPVEIAA